MNRRYYQKVPLLYPSIGFLLGASINLRRPLSGPVKTAVMLLATVTIALFIWIRFVSQGDHRASSLLQFTKVILIIIVFLIAGVLRSSAWSSREKAAKKIVAGDDFQEYTLILTKDMGELGGSKKYIGVPIANPEFTKLLVFLKTPVPTGSIVCAKGRIRLPSIALNPGEFDNRAYLARQGIYIELQAYSYRTIPIEQVVDLGLNARALIGLGKLRHNISSVIEKTVPKREGAILKGILMGDRTQIESDDKESLRRSGLYRFVGISAFHVTTAYWLSVLAIQKITKRKRIGEIFGLLTAIFLTTLSGWGCSCIRAVVSLFLRFLAPRLRRRHDPIAALSLSCFIVAYLVPYPLQDAGFLMSFCGSLGAWFGARFVSTWVLRVVEGSPLQRCVTNCRTYIDLGRIIGLVIFLLPVMAYSFGELTLAGFMVGGLYSAFLMALLPLAVGVLIPPFGPSTFGWLLSLALRGVLIVAEIMSRFPGMLYVVPAPKTYELGAYALMLTTWALQEEQRVSCRGLALLSFNNWRRLLPSLITLLCSVTLLIGAFTRVYRVFPEIVFLAVGQGDCTIIRYKTATILVDTGTESAFKRIVAPYLRRQGITEIDLVILSHLHADHAGGWPSLVSEFQPKAVMVPKSQGDEVRELVSPGTSDVNLYVEEMEENSISKNIGLGRLPVRIFAAAPPRGTEEHSTNNERCLVLTIQLVQGDRLPLVIELWGDADGEAVKRSLDAVRQEKGDVRIIKVPHHGSRDSNAPGLFDCDQPAVAVISVGPNNYGHPSEEILEAVCASKMPLYRTDRHGAVTVTCRGNKVTVVCFCAPCVE